MLGATSAGARLFPQCATGATFPSWPRPRRNASRRAKPRPPPNAAGCPSTRPSATLRVTSEPAPGGGRTARAVPTFMIHKHHATRLHYDLRLEMDDALASLGGAEGAELRPRRQAAGRPDRGSPARVRQLRGAHPRRRIRRRRLAHLGSRRLRHGAAGAGVGAAQEGPPAPRLLGREAAGRAGTWCARAARSGTKSQLDPVQGAATSSPTRSAMSSPRRRARW